MGHFPPGVIDDGEVGLASQAVIIFFVLSGYLVGGSVLRLLREDRWSWRIYLTKRLTRLYVVLIPALLIGATIDYLGSKLFSVGSVYTSPPGIGLVTTYGLAERFRFSILVGNALFLDNFRVPYIGTNVALWSLSNEFWYYMCFPMICLMFAKSQRALARSAWFMVACFILIFTGRFITELFPIWILGAIITIVPRYGNKTYAKTLSIVSGIILLTTMLGVRLRHWHGLSVFYGIAVVASIFIYFVVQQTRPAGRGIYLVLAGFFSRISYTLYLFHVPLAVFLCAILNTPWHRWEKTPKNLLIFAMGDLSIIALGYVLWLAFEANTDRIRIALFHCEHHSERKVT